MLHSTILMSATRIFSTSLKVLPSGAFALTLLSTAEMADAREEDQARSLLEEVIVTATKRAENLQDVPISLTVLDQSTLQRRGVNEFFDYGSSVPNLSFGFTGDGVFTAQTLQIRGIAGADTTGFYIDDLPIPESMNPRVIDIDRIEVLRGPQGSLYGARSMGGTVRLITRQAELGKTYGRLHGQVGTVTEGHEDYAADASFNLQLGDKAALRATAYYLDRTGVLDRRVDNPFDPTDTVFFEDDIDSESSYGGQLSLTLAPTDWLTLQPRVMYQQTELDFLPFADNEPDNFTINRFARLEEPQSDEWLVGSLTATANLGLGTLTSATTYFDRDTVENEDFTEFMTFIVDVLTGVPDFVSPAIFHDENHRETFVEELRFVSDFKGPLQAVLGVFYSQTEDTGFTPPALSPGLSQFLGTDNVFNRDTEAKTREAALFGELSYDITDRLTLTGGGRWFDNEFDFRRTDGGVFGTGALLLNTQSETGFNPKVALEYALTDGFNLYGQAAKGFRIGGVNASLPELCDAELAELGVTSKPDIFDSDEIWNYEIGAKMQWGSVRLNAAAFYIEWQDLQQTVNLPSCGYSFVANTGKARSQGVELELYASPVRGLELSLGFGYTDAEITDPGTAASVRAGDPLEQVPEWNVVASAQYGWAVGTGMDAYTRLDYRSVDESISIVNADRADPRIRPTYNILDARLGITRGAWDTSLFVQNATDERANLSDNRSLAAELPGRPRIVTNHPRTIGIDVRMNFE
jgi:iron complex outermembrane receptor protein